MIFKIFQERGALSRYLEKGGSNAPLELDFGHTRISWVEEESPVTPDSMSFLGSLHIPRKIALIEVPVRGNRELLFHSPAKGYLLKCLDAILEGDTLTIRYANEDPAVLLAYLRSLQDEINREAAEFEAGKG